MGNVSLDTRKRISARKWVQKAIRLYESQGKDAALSEIANPKGKFVRGERCIFAISADGKILAHPMNPELTGKTLTEIKDSGGKEFVQKIISIGKGRGYGFIEYNWPHSKTGIEVRKTVFFEKVDEVIFCSGFYC
jgi:signal transduction histidine kinase